MKRNITTTIDCGDEHCGNCKFRPQNGVYRCEFTGGSGGPGNHEFDIWRKHHKRFPACIQAEKQAGLTRRFAERVVESGYIIKVFNLQSFWECVKCGKTHQNEHQLAHAPGCIVGAAGEFLKNE